MARIPKLTAVPTTTKRQSRYAEQDAGGAERQNLANIMRNLEDSKLELQDDAVVGSVTVSPGGRMQSGATDYNTGTGWWIGNDAGTPKFFVGTAAGNKMTWDGTTLSITGNITVVDGAITTDKLAAGAVTADKINVTSLSAINADMGTITAGTITLPSGGHVKSGQTAYDSGTGFYLGNDASVPVFSIGNSAGAKLTWNGTTLTVTYADGTAIETLKPADAGATAGATWGTNVASRPTELTDGRVDAALTATTGVIKSDKVETASVQNDAVTTRKASAIYAGNRVPAILNSAPLSLTGSGPYGVDVAAFNIRYPSSVSGSVVSYNAGTASGSIAVNTDFVVYCDDPTKAGGSVSYVATATLQDATANDGRIVVGQGRTPASGTAPPIEPIVCVAADSWLSPDLQVRDCIAGSLVHGMTDEGEFKTMQVVARGWAVKVPGRRIEVAGCVVRCSDTTPIVLQDLSTKYAPDIKVGDMMAVRVNDEVTWQPVDSIEPIAGLEVVHISVAGHSFAAGDDPTRLVYTHNAEVKP